jgi:hypothetical protein
LLRSAWRGEQVERSPIRANPYSLLEQYPF